MTMNIYPAVEWKPDDRTMLAVLDTISAIAALLHVSFNLAATFVMSRPYYRVQKFEFLRKS